MFVTAKYRGLPKDFVFKLRRIFVMNSICKNIGVVLGDPYEKAENHTSFLQIFEIQFKKTVNNNYTIHCYTCAHSFF